MVVARIQDLDGKLFVKRTFVRFMDATEISEAGQAGRGLRTRADAKISRIKRCLVAYRSRLDTLPATGDSPSAQKIGSQLHSFLDTRYLPREHLLLPLYIMDNLSFKQEGDV
jgi:hypothetical protein